MIVFIKLVLWQLKLMLYIVNLLKFVGYLALTFGKFDCMLKRSLITIIIWTLSLQSKILNN